MEKKQRTIETLKMLVKEREETKVKINELPKGYIQYKTVSGHNYAFRQWREGNKVKSEYINENFVAVVERKIKMRKTYSQLLKEIKVEIKKTSTKAIKQKILLEEEVRSLIS